jgi:hypothetical protein
VLFIFSGRQLVDHMPKPIVLHVLTAHFFASSFRFVSSASTCLHIFRQTAFSVGKDLAPHIKGGWIASFFNEAIMLDSNDWSEITSGKFILLMR